MSERLPRSTARTMPWYAITALPKSIARRASAPRGNALVLVAAVLLLLAIIGMAYIVRTQGTREIASATQHRAVVDSRIDAIAGGITDEVAGALFMKPIVAPIPANGVAGDPGLSQTTPGLRPMARSDWPRRLPVPTAARYGIDPIDRLMNLLDPGDVGSVYTIANGGNGDGYPDGYNHAPYSVRPWTNWPDTFGPVWGESDPLGNPGYGDHRWLANIEPQRASVLQNGQLVPDPFGTTYSHWAHLSWIANAENGVRAVSDISNIVANTLTGLQGTPLVVPVDPTAIPFGSSLAALGIPYEQWLPGFIPSPLTNTNDFVTRRNSWFTPAGYYNAIHGPFGQPPNPNAAMMLPNCIRLVDPFNSGTILAPGNRPTDAGPTRFLANGLPDDNNNTARNIIERTLADADGNGITDSLWFLWPTSVDRGVRQLVAVRIVDNSAMLNLNIASRFQRRNQVPAGALTPETRESRGHTPADVALYTAGDNTDTAVGFLNSPENSQPTGFFASSPQLTVAFDTARWAGTQEDDPSFLRERGVVQSASGAPSASGLFAEQLRTQSERIRLFKSGSRDGVVQYFNAPPALPQLIGPFGNTSALAPFTAADEAELRLSSGQNQPFILSRLERSLNTEGNTNAFLRSSQSREESSEWTGKQLTLPELLADNRSKLTTVSSARNETMPPALWTRWWNVQQSKLRAIDPSQPLPWLNPPGIDDLKYAYPTLALLEADLANGDPPAYPNIASTQVFTVGGWRPEVIRFVAGDANRDGVFDLRDLDAARRDFFLWNAKLDLRSPVDVDRVGGDGTPPPPTLNPVIDPDYGIFGRMNANGVSSGPDDVVNTFDHAYATLEWMRDFRRRAASALKSEYRVDDDNDVSTPPVRTVASYADRFQLGSDMPNGGFQTQTGTVRQRSIVADGASGTQVDTALRSEKVTDAMIASLTANAATARRGPQFIGPFSVGGGGQTLAGWYTSQPLLPSHPSASASDGSVPETRIKVPDPDPTLPGSNPPGGSDIYFAGVDPHPVIMEAFFAVVWPKTRLGSTWQFAIGTNNPSVISPKPADPYSVPTNYNDGGNESHFVAIVPQGSLVDQTWDWSPVAPAIWQRQSTAVVAVQVANPYPHPIRLADFQLQVFGQTYNFPVFELDANGNQVLGPDTDGDGTADPMALMLGPGTEAEPRTAIVFAITDHNQLNYLPGDSASVQHRYPLTKGVEFDPFFRARWLDYLDIVEATDLGGSNPGLQSAGLSGATPSAFCPHTVGILGTEGNQGVLTASFPRRRLLGTSRQSSVVFGSSLAANNLVAQTKILDATQELGTDVASYRPDQGIVLRRRLRNPETGVILGTVIVDRFDRDANDTNQSSADPISGWNLSMAAELLLEVGGRFWPPEIDAGLSSNEDQMYPLLNAPPAPPPAPQPPPPWHLKPQQGSTFNGIRINTNDYFITWTRSSRLWGKDFAVVFGANAVPVAYDRNSANNNGKGDGLITPDERAPRYAFASSKQHPDLPGDGAATSGVLFADGIGPFRGRNSSEKYSGAAFQAQVGLTPWAQDLTFNYGGSAQPYPLPTILKNPANDTVGQLGAGDPDMVGALVGGVPLKGNQLLPFVRNYTTSLLVNDSNWPPANFSGALNLPILRVAMKPTSFTTKSVVGVPQGETTPRQIFGLSFSTTTPFNVSNPATFLADKGMRPPVLDSSLDVEVEGSGSPQDLAVAIDKLLPMDGGFALGQKNADFDTVAEVTNLMVWGPAYELNGTTRHTLSEILTDRVPGYPVGLVHRYVDLNADGFSTADEQNPAWAHLNRIYIDNPSLAFSWFDESGSGASPASQRFLWQWGGAVGTVGAFASSLPLGTRLLDAFTLDDRGTTLFDGNFADLPQSADLNGNGFSPPANQENETKQWLEDRRFRLAGGYSNKGTPGLINVNTAPVEVLRALPHMSRLVYNDGFDLDGDGAGDMFEIDTNNDGILDGARTPPQASANPFVRVPETIDLYRSRIQTGWTPDLVHSSRANRNVAANNQPLVPHYLDRGQIPGDLNGDNFQDTGFFPGMRAERGLDSLGEAMLMTRTTAAVDGADGGSWGWNDNQSWSIRFAGLDPFRRSQAPANNAVNFGGGYRQLTANGAYLNPPYNARISTDSFRGERLEFGSGSGGALTLREVPTLSTVTGDAREQDLLLSSLSNILTTRSDVFTVYLRVRSVKADPVTGRYDGTDPKLIVDDSRFVMCIDRSQVERPGDAPRIVYFHRAPQ